MSINWLVCLFSIYAFFLEGDQSDLKLDHVILAIYDLQTGIEEFESKTGVRPVFGGEHPGNGTQNAIVTLSNGQYIEILAPSDDLDSVPEFFRNYRELTPIGLALSVEDIDDLHASVEQLGYRTDGPQAGSRKTSDDILLSWHTLMIQDPDLFISPFFICWSSGTRHPSESNEPYCSLKWLELTSPSQKEIKSLISNTGGPLDDLKIKKGSARLVFSLDTPKGTCTFRG